GIVEADPDPADPRLSRITRLVEKPAPGATTSTRAVIGRYVLSPRIFHHLRTMPAGAGGEIQLTDGLSHLLAEERVVAHERSVGRGAAKCFVSQPALAVAVQKLEDELGAPLSERGKSEVGITPVGERVVEQAQRVLEEVARLRDIAKAAQDP